MSWIDEKGESTSSTGEEIYRHFREGYSTYGFFLEPMLERIGFEPLESRYEAECYAGYVCRWHGSPE